ncbi:MAG: copper-binding protein [Proteobacteria bacterium]|nr:copper-binding protein [Pseudomonadota bacterium]
MKSVKTLAAALLGASVLLSSAVMAENHVITTKGATFSPLVVKVAPGDTVSWENMNTHITETITEYLPAGAEGWISGMGESFTTPPLTVEGAYIYKCTPHWGMAMGGVIIVGTPTNLDDIKAKKPKGAAKRLYKKAVKAAK